MSVARADAAARGLKRVRADASLADDEAFHGDDEKLPHLLDLHDGVCLFLLPAVGHIDDAPFEQVVSMKLIEHDERMGNVHVGGSESDVMVS